MVSEIVLERITGKMKDLRAECLGYGIPMLCFIAVDEPDGGETGYISEAVTPFEAGVELADDRVTKLSAALSGDFEIQLKIKRGSVGTDEMAAEMFAELIDDD